MTEAPHHEFDGPADPLRQVLIVTPELQAWAADALERLAAEGWPAPADLTRLREGETMTHHHWHWLLHYLRSPRPPCPF